MRARGYNTPLGRVTAPSVNGTPIAYTPAVTWPGNTLAGATGQYIKIPGALLLWVSFSETAGTTSALVTIPLPPGYTAVTMAGSLTIGVGAFGRVNVASEEMFIASGGTLITGINVGAIDTWSGFFCVPTTT